MKNVRGRDITMSFQDPMTFLNPVMRIEDQIAEVCIRHLKMSEADALKRAVDVMASVQIQDPSRVAKSYPHQLSGGMRQRILLAIAISCDPGLLIVDEPTTALDVITQTQIIGLLRKLRRDLGLAAVIITHDMGVAVQVCDRLAVMYAGHIVEQADTKVVISNPLHPYTSGLLQSIAKIDTPRGALKYIPGTVPNLIEPPAGCIFNPRCLDAKGDCRTSRPEMVEVEKGHFVACMKFSKRDVTDSLGSD
jgi:oligopeptide/dipeptide ABC transporter ATP-binding protein